MNTNDELYFKDCFTEIDEDKINAKFNKTTMRCFDSEDNKFSMDCEGNLVVNSIITRESNPTSGLTIDQIYPVGTFYLSSSSISPSTLFGGTWKQIKDKFLLSCGDKYSSGSTGGEETHLLTESEMPSHKHSVFRGTDGSSFFGLTGKEPNPSCPYGVETTAAGGNQPHNNMPPYLAVYVWERIA